MIFDDIDKIYFLHLSDRYDREKWMNSQIEQIGFPKEKVNIWWTCRRNISKEIYDDIKSLHIDFYDDNILTNPYIGASVFNCAFEHYSIIRTSYERGFKHILIFEDDIKFLVNLDIFKKFISLLPEEYNVCKFHYNLFIEGNLSDESSNFKIIPNENTDITDPYILYNNFGDVLYSSNSNSTMSYIIDRNGMKSIIDLYNKNFCAADLVFSQLQDVNVYHCNYQLVSSQDYNCKPEEYMYSELWKINTNQIYNQFK